MDDFVTLCRFLGIEKSLVQGMTKKIKDIYILRRTKDDLAKINERLRLPPCYFENVELDMYPDERDMYEFVFQGGSGYDQGHLQGGNQSQLQEHGHFGVPSPGAAVYDLAPNVPGWGCEEERDQA